MSAVETAVKKVQGLSEKRAKALLGWLSEQESATRRVRRSPATPRKRKARRSMRSLMAWYDSIRGTTDWEPPRMPDDLVRRVSL
jgi:hypothetical protein